MQRPLLKSMAPTVLITVLLIGKATASLFAREGYD